MSNIYDELQIDELREKYDSNTLYMDKEELINLLFNQHYTIQMHHKKEYYDLMDKLEDYEDDNDRLDSEIKTLERQNFSLENINSNLRDEIIRLQDEIVKLEDTIDDLRFKYQ